MGVELLSDVAWILISFFWQGIVIGAGAYIALQCIGRYNSTGRYLIAVMALFLMFLAPIVTGLFLFVSEAPLVLPKMVTDEAPLLFKQSSPPLVMWLQYVSYQNYLPFITLLWGLGVICLSLKYCAGIYTLRKLRIGSLKCVEENIVGTIKRLARQLGVYRQISVYETAQTLVPCVMGFWRPIIFVPISGFTGLSTVQIELILMHEIAHIKRHDYLVNIIQCMLELLLFFHPIVHWISKVIREERENCCDEIALHHHHQPMDYARALLVLANYNQSATGLSLSATDGDFMVRIKRCLAVKKTPANFNYVIAMFLLLIPALSVFAYSVTPLPDEPLNRDEAIEKAVVNIKAKGLSKEKILDEDLSVVSLPDDFSESEIKGKAENDVAVILDKKRVYSKPPPKKLAVLMSRVKEPMMSERQVENESGSQVPLPGEFLKKPNISSQVLKSPKIGIAEDQRLAPELQLKTKFKISYPRKARSMRLNGYVLVSYRVEASGEVKGIEIIEAKPAGIFDRVVKNAIANLRYEAYQPEPYDAVLLTRRVEFNQYRSSKDRRRTCITGSRICRAKGGIPTQNVITISGGHLSSPVR